MSKLLLDRYEILEEAGSGGFASVMVAWDTRIERKVAIKIMELSGNSLEQLSPKDGSTQSILLEDKTQKAASQTEKTNHSSADEEAADTSASASLEIPGLEEARTAAKLNDANIVSVYDFEVQGNYAYLILEYVDGITLAEFLARFKEDIDSDIIASVFKSVSHALEVAHKNKVLHLDIKPENILIDQQGNVKVTDFGLARFVGENGFGTAAGGTIGYMPPEQMRQEPLDERCDEWALASLTYEMITGTNPFLAPSIEKALKKVEGAEIVVPSLYLDDADDSVDDILFCALDPDKTRRYDSVADFAHEMQQCLGSPRKGKRRLAELVGQLEEIPEESVLTAEEDEYREPFQGISSKMQHLIARVVSAASVVFIAFVAVVNIQPLIAEGWASPISWIALAFALILGIFLPAVGAGLALIFLGIVLCSHGVYLVGALFIAFAVIWWALSGRRGLEDAFPVIVLPLVGAFGLAPLTPYLAASRLRVPYALLTTLFAFFLAFLFACFGSGSVLGWNVFSCLNILSTERFDIALQALMFSPSTWLMLLAWLLTVLLTALFGRAGKTWLSCVGVGLSTLIMVAALILGGYVLGISQDASALLAPEPAYLFSVIAAGVLAMLIFIVAPYRDIKGVSDEEEALPAATDKAGQDN